MASGKAIRQLALILFPMYRNPWHFSLKHVSFQRLNWYFLFSLKSVKSSQLKIIELRVIGIFWQHSENDRLFL